MWPQIQVMCILLQTAGHPIIFCYKITHHHTLTCQRFRKCCPLRKNMDTFGRGRRGWWSLTGIPDAGRWSCLDDHPLQDAGVFPTGGDQVTVIVQEGNVGHMAAVTAVLVARSLRERVKKLDNHGIISLLDFGKTPELSKWFSNYDRHCQALCGLATKCP